MLLGSGNLLNNLPLTQIGGVINNTNWMNPSLSMVGVDSFDKKSSLPNGYGGRAFYLPLKAGGISAMVLNSSTALANGNNGVIACNSDILGTLSGVVGMVGNITVVGSATGTLIGKAIASGDIVIVTTISGELVSVLNAQGSSSTLCTVDGNVVGAVNGIGNCTAVVTINADMVGIFDGYGSSSSTSSLINISSGAIGNAIINIGATALMSGTLLAKGFMVGGTTAISETLTAKDVWEYYQRTLTAGGSDGSSYTLEQIAAAVRNAMVGDIYAASLI